MSKSCVNSFSKGGANAFSFQIPTKANLEISRMREVHAFCVKITRTHGRSGPFWRITEMWLRTLLSRI